MLGGTLVSVIIGLIFFFLLLSIFTTTLQELIASWLNLRGRNLMRALDELIKNDRQREDFFEQPQVYSLFSGKLSGNIILQTICAALYLPFTLTAFLPSGKWPTRMPSSLEPSTFAKAAMGALGQAVPAGDVTAPLDGAAPALIKSLQQRQIPNATIEHELEELYNT